MEISLEQMLTYKKSIDALQYKENQIKKKYKQVKFLNVILLS